MGRAYFYDRATRRELTSHPCNGMALEGNGPRVNDQTGTTASVYNSKRTVTAADFTAPVDVKLWYGPDFVEWAQLEPSA